MLCGKKCKTINGDDDVSVIDLTGDDSFDDDDDVSVIDLTGEEDD